MPHYRATKPRASTRELATVGVVGKPLSQPPLDELEETEDFLDVVRLSTGLKFARVGVGDSIGIVLDRPGVS